MAWAGGKKGGGKWGGKGGGGKGGGGGGWGGGGGGQQQEELLWGAVASALQPVIHLETEWDTSKLEKKIREYFRKGVKHLEFGMKPFHALIDEYCDYVFSSIFSALGDREWLHQVDFLLVVDAGVKDNFPEHILASVPQQAFEQAVLSSHDRAFEEQRYCPLLWHTVETQLEGKETRKKVYAAGEEGRKQAGNGMGTRTQSATNEVEDFTARWIECSLAHLARSGDLEHLLPVDSAKQLFHSLIEAGSLPIALVQASNQLPRYEFVEQCVRWAYGSGKGGGGGGYGKGKGKGKSKGKGKMKAPSEDEDAAIAGLLEDAGFGGEEDGSAAKKMRFA
eukprot:gnl/TRDRNA2_/TRDRNA2_186925_c0_seq1.p1 gnl/TRDRNA2_/TRDRNA2_186925_c0~~gnl/TRDRNA2_/TRDRNA2_186925_c0_seq1.p1  ORF type:complete len:345 (+),score=78.98 gnl/TRDRNA2_/TRDRNA2_186925_c0_seq1:33-1037(+)